jgi:general secretion pathway protein C
MILLDPNRSIATIEDKSAALIYPVRVDDEIPGKAKILSVEPRRVVFINVSSGRKEYIDLPEESQDNPRIAVGGSRPTGPGIEQVSPTQFNISRNEVDKTLADLNNVLTQARAVPNFENGMPAGYKLFQIVPGSIYDKLGLKNGDTIAGLNGQPITDPGKAFEMLSALKEQSHVDIQVKRDGRAQSFSYDFH